jgi:carnitine-CoA ligase
MSVRKKVGRASSPSLHTLACYPPHGGTLWSLLGSRAERGRDRPFLLSEGTTWSWEAFRHEVERTAAMLHGRGIGKGDRVAVMAPNSDQYVVLFFALARLGAILVPVNPDFGVAEAGYILEHAEASAIACSPAALTVARQAAQSLPRSPWFMTLGGEAEGVPSLVALSAAAPPCTSLPADAHPDDICLILYTSGTTGFPKGVMHSQASFVLAGEGFVERMRLVPDDRLLCILPLFHINALFYSLGGTVAAGASLVLAPRFSASKFWQLAAQTGATEVNIIAAVGNILVRRPRVEFNPGHRLVKVYGAPVTAEIATVFKEDFGIDRVIEGYGMTEVPGACNIPFDGPYRIGSMGKAALHPDRSIRFAELRVVDEEGRDVGPGEVGELLVRTPIVMKGYYRDEAQTSATFRDGWFITGDLVRRDEEGFYTFVARKKDIIRRRGENVSGAELDRIIGQHPAVAEAAAIGVPSELGEEEILVAVVVRAGERLQPSDIRDWCAAHLAALKMPRYLVFADALPHTPTHRVAKFKLKQDPDLLKAAVDLDALAAKES